MDSPAAANSGRRAGSRGGKPRQHRLGLRKVATPTPSPVVPPATPISSPATPTTSPAAPTAMTAAPTPTFPALNPVHGSPSPASSVPLQPPQGAGWGAIPPNFASYGNQRGPNPWMYPSGGSVNFVPQPQVQGENFHFVGQNMSFNPISPPPPRPVNSEAVKQGDSTNKTVTIDIDKEDNGEANKANTKRFWSVEEEERLAHAWLNTSKDPIHGNDKKGDTFWKEITDLFNKKGNGKRRREINQLKVHWSRLKASITEFNDCWTKATQTHTSGYSDDMLEKEAQKMYENRCGKPFLLVHWWKILKDEPKWCAQFQDPEKDNSEMTNVPDEQLRPLGREAAKAERSGKRKKDNIMEGIVVLGDNIDKIVKMQEYRKVEREKVTEAQIQISSSNLMAAKEQKEAKMFEVYNSLLNQDISQMSEDQKASRDRVIRKIEEKLFSG